MKATIHSYPSPELIDEMFKDYVSRHLLRETVQFTCTVDLLRVVSCAHCRPWLDVIWTRTPETGVGYFRFAQEYNYWYQPIDCAETEQILNEDE